MQTHEVGHDDEAPEDGHGTRESVDGRKQSADGRKVSVDVGRKVSKDAGNRASKDAERKCVCAPQTFLFQIPSRFPLLFAAPPCARF